MDLWAEHSAPPRTRNRTSVAMRKVGARKCVRSVDILANCCSERGQIYTD
jgi:hypothetical protein